MSTSGGDLDELRRLQGPHSSKPDFPVPEIPDWGWGLNQVAWRHWAQVKNGDWYAFYCECSPSKNWNEEHPDDPNWWFRKGHAGKDSSDTMACRHGAYRESCPDPSGSCGEGPRRPRLPITEQEITDAMKLTAQLIQEVESL